MIVSRTMTTHTTTSTSIHSPEAAVEEAMRLLATQTTERRWVCEVCGMVHTATPPTVCDGCGVSTALVQQAALHREINSHW